MNGNGRLLKIVLLSVVLLVSIPLVVAGPRGGVKPLSNTDEPNGYYYYTTQLVSSWTESECIYKTGIQHVLVGGEGSISISKSFTVYSHCYTTASDGTFITVGAECGASHSFSVTYTYTDTRCFRLKVLAVFNCKKYRVKEWYHDYETGEDILCRTWYEYHKHYSHYDVVPELISDSYCSQYEPPEHSNYDD